jgi:formylglycine-generating enzyme required for sulfatase activity
MKTQFLIIIFLSLFLNGFCQLSSKDESAPKDMVFIPAGNFTMPIQENNIAHEITVSVHAFWMSDEITNSVYREFADFVRDHPDWEICWVDLASLAKDRELGITNTKREDYLHCVRNSDIIDNIIDKENLPYADYFDNEKYNDYPVVGVSQENARYYCIWRSDMENRKRQKEGKTYNYNDYRLPIEAEWAYVASHTLIKKKKNKSNSKIKPSKSGKQNDFGLYNFAGNVSEWTASSKENRMTASNEDNPNKDMKIVRGGSWKTDLDPDKRNELNQSEGKDYIGFRIVQSYVNKQK